MKAIEDQGWSNIVDQNARFDDGFFPVAYSHTDTMRMGAAWRYLTAEVRRRPNLTVIGASGVDRLVFDGVRCTGVRMRGPDGDREIRAREVIVSSGAIHSPVLLMRSGIGAAHELRTHGIAVVADRPGVGKHLMEHPGVNFGCFLKRPARLPGELRRQMFSGLRWSSGLAGCPPGDMYVIPTNKAQWHAIGQRLGIIMMWVNRSFSTGEIRLSGPAADAPPDIDFNMCSDERDMVRLVKGVKLLAKLQAHPAVQDGVEEVFPISFSAYAQKLAIHSRWNALQTFVGAQAMDASAIVRRAIIHAIIADAPSVDDLVNDEETCRTWIRSATTRRAPAAWAGRTMRSPSPMRRRASTASKGCAWPTRRSCPACRAQIPTCRPS
jgi:5-(hydroxymethyl)furfural/furfural oxidase